MTITQLKQRRPLIAIVGLAGCVIALSAVARIAVGSRTGQRLDQSALETVWAGRDAELTLLSLLGRVSIGGVLLVAALCAGAALLRGRGDLALGALAVIAGSNVTTQALKRIVIERPDFGFGTLNSLPSGHTTVVASGVGAMVLAIGNQVRHLIAVCGAFAVTLTGTSTVVAAWHRPADVVAALVVTLAWMCLVSIPLAGRRQITVREFFGSIVGAGAALLALIAVGVRPLQGWAGFFEAGLVLGAVALATAVFIMATCVVVPRGTWPRVRALQANPAAVA